MKNSWLKRRHRILKLFGTMRGAVTNAEKANTLNKYFASVFTEEPLGNLPSVDRPTNSMNDLHISAEAIEKKLRQLNPNKSAGPDRIHPRILKETAREISLPLEILFSKSLADGSLPIDWKEARITALYKQKGDKSHAANYRPISLTSVVCKILESFIREAVLDFVTSTNQLNENQHGFLPGKGCHTNLIETFDDITESLDKKVPMDVVYVDFSKAFDTVPHTRLLIKLESLIYQAKYLGGSKTF